MPHRIAILLALALCGGALFAQPQETSLEYMKKDDKVLSHDADLQQRRAAVREAVAIPKAVPGHSVLGLPAGRQLSPQERADLRQQLRHQRNEVPRQTM